MKRNKENLYRKIINFFEKKYKAPEECKLILAERNLVTMFKAQAMLITLGFFGLISLLITQKGNYSASIPRFIYFGEYIVFGIVCIIASAKLKKINFARSFIKMIPTYFLFFYLMVYPMFILFYEKNTFNAMVVYACITVNFPIFFNISPAVFTPVITIASVALMTRITKEYSFFISMDSIIFVMILYFLSFKRWATEKDNYLHHRSEHEYKENIENEIQLAQVVQQSFFKHNETIYDDWAISYYNKPMAGVSGDFLDIYSNGNMLDGIGIFDVSGHGIASGLVTMLVKNIIFQEFYNGREDKLKAIIDRINIRYIKEKGNIENYLTGILIRTEGNKVEIVNAGHPAPIIYKSQENKCYFYDEERKFSSSVVGLSSIESFFQESEFEMKKGDEIILFTDGVKEALNSEHAEYGTNRIMDSVKRAVSANFNEQIPIILSDMGMFTKNESQSDDITIVIIKKK